MFQFYNLMPSLTALENVELARQVCPNALDPVRVLEQVGLGERMNNFPAQLSGGEQQRVSIARALCKNCLLYTSNPMIGAAGISAFPMSSRVIAKMALKDDPSNFILMQATSANVAGQLGSIVAGGMVITLVSMLLG